MLGRGKTHTIHVFFFKLLLLLLLLLLACCWVCMPPRRLHSGINTTGSVKMPLLVQLSARFLESLIGILHQHPEVLQSAPEVHDGLETTFGARPIFRGDHVSHGISPWECSGRTWKTCTVFLVMLCVPFRKVCFNSISCRGRPKNEGR